MAAFVEGVPDPGEDLGEEVGVGPSPAPVKGGADGGGDEAPQVSSVSIIPSRQEFVRQNKLKESVGHWFQTRDITVEELLDFDEEDLEDFANDLQSALKKDFDTLSKKRFLKGIRKIKEAEQKAVAGMIGKDGVPVMAAGLPPGGMTSISGEGADMVGLVTSSLGGATSVAGEGSAATGGGTLGTASTGGGAAAAPRPAIHALMDQKQHEMMARVYARYDRSEGMLQMLVAGEKRLEERSAECKALAKTQLKKLTEQLSLRKTQLAKELDDIRKDKLDKLERQLEELMLYKQSIEHGQKQYDELVGDESLTIHQRKKKVLKMVRSINESKPSLVMVTQPKITFEFDGHALDSFLGGIIIDDCDAPLAPTVRILKVTSATAVLEWVLPAKDLLKDVHAYAVEVCLLEVLSLERAKRKKKMLKKRRKAAKSRKRKKARRGRSGRRGDYSSSEDSASSHSSSMSSSMSESSSEVSSSSESSSDSGDEDEAKYDSERKKRKRRKGKRKKHGYETDSESSSESSSDSGADDDDDMYSEEALHSGDEADATLYGRRKAERRMGDYSIDEADDFGEAAIGLLMAGRSTDKLKWQLAKLYDAKAMHVAMCGLSSKFEEVRSQQLATAATVAVDTDEADASEVVSSRGVVLKDSLFGGGVVRSVVPRLKQRGRYLLRVRAQNANGWGLYSYPYAEFRVKECRLPSKMLSSKEMETLMHWLPKKLRSKRFKLLFRASRDGFTSYAFHQKCDTKGATISLIESTNGNIFGGYAQVSWTSNGNYVQDSAAFIFLIRAKNGKKTGKFGVTNATNSLYHNSSYGPTFGGGFDIYIANGCNANTSSYSNPGTSFSCPQDQTYFAGSYNFMVKDYEVFQIK